MIRFVPSFIIARQRAGETAGRFPATALFVDISGFTPITDALMREGVEGGETLANVMARIFEPLVTAVHQHGGFVLNYAGDAFTAVFPVDESEPAHSALRGVAAATIGQTALRANRRVQTPQGAFTFRAKMGLARGDVEWGILSAADAPHTFYFKGPGVDRSAAAEMAAAPDEIVLDGRMVRALGDAVDVDTLDAPGLFRLADVRLAHLPLHDLPAPDPTGEAAFAPPALRHLTSPGEFRQVVTLFLMLEGAPDHDALRRFHTLLTSLQQQYGGYLNRILFGDKGCNVLLFWGAPTMDESDVRRALRLALDLRARAGLRLRAGVTYQLMYAGLVGAPHRNEYSCYGRGVNLAARFMSAADWGDIWLDAASARRAERDFDIQFVADHAFKGFAVRQPVYALHGRRQAPAAVVEGALVGRQAELQQLADFMAPLAAGRFAGAVVIEGEAGIGKSRLVYEWQRRTEARPDGPRWLVGRADAVRRRSLNPFRYILRPLFAQSFSATPEANKKRFNAILDAAIAAESDLAISAELDRTRSILGALLDLHWPGSLYEQLEPALRFQNSLNALKTLLIAGSRQQPTVVVIEDAHWLDADSRQLLAKLTRNIANLPLGIIVTTRHTPDEPAAFFPDDVRQLQLTLGPLSRDDVATIVANLLDAAPARELVDLIAGRAEGNPLFVEQLLRYLQDQQLLVDSPRGLRPRSGRMDLPGDIRAIFIARLDRLAREVRDTVQTAAVLGREFTVQVLLTMLREEDEISTRVAAAESAAIWVALTEIRYLFKHALLRDAAYEMQLRSRRRRLHRLAAEALVTLYANDPSPHYADMSYHYGRAGDRRRERRYARLAGLHAAAQFDNEQALLFLSRALELTPASDMVARQELLRARERVHNLLGAREAQVQDLFALQLLADRLDDDQRRAEAALAMADYFNGTGQYEAAGAAAETAVRLGAELNDPVVEAEGHLQWGRMHWRTGERPRAEALFARALALAQAAGDDRIEAHCLRNLGNIALDHGDYHKARAYFQRAQTIAELAGDRRRLSAALTNVGNVYFVQEQYETAATYYNRSLAIKQAIGDRQGETIARYNLGFVADEMGDFDTAAGEYRAALRIAVDIGDRRHEAAIRNNLGFLAQAQGDYASAGEQYEAALAVFESIGDRLGVCQLQADLALLNHLQARHETARALAAASVALARELGDQAEEATALTNLGFALGALEQYEAAATALRDALALRRALHRTGLALESQAGLARLAFQAGDLSQATAVARAVWRAVDREGLRGTYEPVRVYLTCYEVLTAGGDPAAVDALTAGHALVEKRAATIRDPARRRQFYERVAANQALLAAWRRHNGAA